MIHPVYSPIKNWNSIKNQLIQFSQLKDKPSDYVILQ